MDNSSTADDWYNSSKATLRPLVAFSEEGFELESNRLCTRYEQFAADCVAENEHKGLNHQSIARVCEKKLAAALICKTKIACPIELHDFHYKCKSKVSQGYSDPGCQKAVSALSQCASRVNIPAWWMTPAVRPANREELDEVSIRHMSKHGSKPTFLK